MNVLDLCSGIGGFSLGLEWTGGFETIAFCENSADCQTILKTHWPSVPIYDDVITLTGKQLENDGITDIRLICSGFPCQPYSVAGLQKGATDDRAIWPEILRLIKEIKPHWILLENVIGFIHMGFDECVTDLANSGYEVQGFNIPACAVNAPHERKRIFIVGSLATNSDGEGLERREEIECEERGIKRIVGARDPLATSRRGWISNTGILPLDDGIHRRIPRLKMVGNSIVPQLIEVLGRTILLTEQEFESRAT